MICPRCSGFVVGLRLVEAEGACDTVQCVGCGWYGFGAMEEVYEEGRPWPHRGVPEVKGRGRKAGAKWAGKRGQR